MQVGCKFSLVLVSVLVLGAPFASAKKHSDKTATRALKQGVEKCDRGDYDAGIAALTRSYKLNERPVVLFHLGRCHASKGDCSAAMGFLDRYLQTSPPGKLRQAAVELQRKCAAAAKPAQSQPSAPSPTEVAQAELPRSSAPNSSEIATSAKAPMVATSEPHEGEQQPAVSDASTTDVSPAADVRGAPSSEVEPAPDLEEAEKAPPWYASSWLWTVAGGIVAASAGAVAVAVH